MPDVLIVAKRTVRPDRSQTLRLVTLEAIPANSAVRQLSFDEATGRGLPLPDPEDITWLDEHNQRRKLVYWCNNQPTHTLVGGPDPCRSALEPCDRGIEHVRHHHPPTTYHYTWWEVPDDLTFKLLVRDFTYDTEHKNTFVDHIVLARPGGQLLQQPNGSDDAWWKEFQAETYHTSFWAPAANAEPAKQASGQ